MKISYAWLRQFVSTDLDAATAAALLTSGGLEVEHVEPFSPVPGGLAGLVVGHVAECGPHPDADRLRVTKVDVGGPELLQIVCGAPNVAAGQRVVVAPVGATVHPVEGEPFTIRKAKIRGQLSEGMICAEDEIGLGTSHEGIMVLRPDAPIGHAAAEVLDVATDWVLEIGLTPNRTDAMSHVGVARDLRALVRSHRPEVAVGPLQWPDVMAFSPTLGPNPIAVEVRDADAAPRYVGIYLKGLRVGPSPAWLADALRSIGLRPINNLVDVTNYVLHGMGQPLHAFDVDRIGGGRVVVRRAADAERFVTLDGVERKLAATDLMICDAAAPMCLAGVFGGAGSGVTEGTTSVFLESAYFNPSVIRKGAKRHGLSTDASFRFERGVDPETVVHAAKWAALLMQQVAGGEYSEVTDLYPQPIHYHKVSLDLKRMDSLIGQHMPLPEVKAILADLDIAIDKEKDGVLHLMVPTCRHDVTREADVVEEVLRIYGHDRIAGRERISIPITASAPDARPALRDVVADRLAAMGLNEMMANSLMPEAQLNGLFPEYSTYNVQVLNALSTDLNVLRQDLVFGMLEAVARNIRHQRPDLRLFEFGTVYHRIADGDWPYHEEEALGIVLTGRAWAERWGAPAGAVGFNHLKGLVDGLLQGLGAKVRVTDHPDRQSPFAYGLVYTVGDREVVRLGEVRPDVLRHFEIHQPVMYADVRFTHLCEAIKGNRVRTTELPRHPSVTRDLALIIDRSVTYAQLHTAASRQGKGLLRSIDLFDVYEGKGIPEGKRSYALRFVLQDADATLTDQRIDDTMGRIRASLERECGAELRG